MAEDETPRTYVGAYALCVRGARLLLARLAPGLREAGRWTLPGGGLNWGEDPAAGVLRELTEETGLTGTVTGLAGVYSRTYPRSAERPFPPVHHLGILYTVDPRGEALRDETGGSTDRCAWIPLPELARTPLVPLAAFGAALLEQGPAGRSVPPERP
jgi:ADP-ribose pyrophosphatase YjhB (NUDIX family)